MTGSGSLLPQAGCTRREFIAASAAAVTLFLAGQSLSSDFPDLVIASKADPPLLVEKAISALGGMKRFVGKGMTVVVKPNMAFPNRPEMGTTTNPQVVAAVSRLCVEAGAKRVLVLDNPLRRPEVCLERNGIREACAEIDHVSVQMLTAARFFVRQKIPRATGLVFVDVMRQAMECDALINVPVAKCHNAAGVSVGLKNLMGLILDREVFHGPLELHYSIAELATFIRPALTVVDGTRVLVTGGPAGPGKVMDVGKVLAGTDPVGVDSAAVELAPWYGRSFSGLQVKHLLFASRLGVGQVDWRKLRYAEV